MKPRAKAPQRTPVPRLDPDPSQGLTTREATVRAAAGWSNRDPNQLPKRVSQIIRDNLCTFFNALFVALALCLFAVGAYRDMLFLGIVVCNVLIGIVQELRVKRTLDRIALLSAPTATVVRDGERRTSPTEELVLDDIVLLSAGRSDLRRRRFEGGLRRGQRVSPHRRVRPRPQASRRSPPLGQLSGLGPVRRPAGEGGRRLLCRRDRPGRQGPPHQPLGDDALPGPPAPLHRGGHRPPGHRALLQAVCAAPHLPPLRGQLHRGRHGGDDPRGALPPGQRSPGGERGQSGPPPHPGPRALLHRAPGPCGRPLPGQDGDPDPGKDGGMPAPSPVHPGRPGRGAGGGLRPHLGQRQRHGTGPQGPLCPA